MNFDLTALPLSHKAIKEQLSADSTYITGVVGMDLDSIINHNLETFLNDLAKKLIGSVLITDMTYKVVGSSGETIFIEVTGDVTDYLDYTVSCPSCGSLHCKNLTPDKDFYELRDYECQNCGHHFEE